MADTIGLWVKRTGVMARPEKEVIEARSAALTFKNVR
jgi:hypothetical protein